MDDNVTIAGGPTAALLRLGPPPLAEGESQADFLQLLQDFAEAVAPRDGLERNFLREAVDITWEIRRLRKMKRSIMHSGMPQALTALLPPEQRTSGEWERSVDDYITGDPEAVACLNERRDAMGLTTDDLLARAYAAQIESMEQIERMLANAEHRRRLLLADVDRHREFRCRLAAVICSADGEV